MSGARRNWHAYFRTLRWLHNNQLTGPIPEVIGQLTTLQYLNLGENQLTGSIPDVIGQLTDLQFLYLENNQLTGEVHPSLFQLRYVQVSGIPPVIPMLIMPPI